MKTVDVIEVLADAEHQQWMRWAQTLMQTEKISNARAQRWHHYCVDYKHLTEDVKEFDRKEARLVLSALRDAGYEVVPREPTDAMIMAAIDRPDAQGIKSAGASMYETIWRAMVAAANPAREESAPQAAKEAKNAPSGNGLVSHGVRCGPG